MKKILGYDVEELLNGAFIASNIGSGILKKYFKSINKNFNNKTDNILQAESKGIRDIVTIADRESERNIIDFLNYKFEKIKIFAEESGGKLTDDPVWLIDPLDGTKNFFRGLPEWGVSIGLVIDKKPVLGVINIPFYNEIYTVIKGQGVYVNGEKLYKSEKKLKLEESFLVTGFPHSKPQYTKIYIKGFTRLIDNVMGIRRLGAAIYDFALVAKGVFDGFWEFGLMPWDTAAGVLVCEETGMKISDCYGNEWFVDSDSILVANGYIYDRLLDIIKNS